MNDWRERELRKRVFEATYREDEPLVYGKLGAAQSLIRLLDEQLLGPSTEVERVALETLFEVYSADPSTRDRIPGNWQTIVDRVRQRLSGVPHE